jgi:hypothetical protein
MFLKDGRLHVYGVSEDGATIFAHYGIKSLKQIADGERAAACTQTNSLDAIDYPAALTECLPCLFVLFRPTRARRYDFCVDLRCTSARHCPGPRY